VGQDQGVKTLEEKNEKRKAKEEGSILREQRGIRDCAANRIIRKQKARKKRHGNNLSVVRTAEEEKEESAQGKMQL